MHRGRIALLCHKMLGIPSFSPCFHGSISTMLLVCCPDEPPPLLLGLFPAGTALYGSALALQCRPSLFTFKTPRKSGSGATSAAAAAAAAAIPVFALHLATHSFWHHRQFTCVPVSQHREAASIALPKALVLVSAMSQARAARLELLEIMEAAVAAQQQADDTANGPCVEEMKVDEDAVVSRLWMRML
eukprot:1158612-Pelagomonas_calceolata.AAC.11